MRARRPIRLMHALMGRRRARPLLALAVSVLVAGLFMLAMLGRMQFIRQAYDWAGTTSVGDAVLWLLMGHQSLPAAGWASVWCTVSVMALIDIQGTGEFDQGIVAAGSRCGAWVAYACSAALLAVLTYTFMIVACLMWSVLAGLAPTLSPESIQDISLGLVAPGCTMGNVLSYLGLGLLGAAFLGLLELAVGLWAGGAASFGLAVAMLAVSALAPTVPLPGSFLMACRVAPLGTGLSPDGGPAFPSELGLAVLIVPSVVMVLVGALRFSRMDLGIKGKEARR
ncbi:hypothetical protein [Olsenella sp. Marseille-P4559]|uniref:hypothetical protein n=1 Tax=Olsenella sp. Marseille-P4559 TaxID=2364795 RepID=UPI001030AEE9|nr:hypothetical protein [Olsenella sp. Marseille-P4559]